MEVQTVRIYIIKAQGETFTFFYHLTFPSCHFESETATFKLYREQPMEVIAYTEAVLPGFTQIRATAYLSWDDVYPGKDFGGTFNWEPDIVGYWLYN